jgi:ABC-type sugar transport system ATPase subunit
VDRKRTVVGIRPADVTVSGSDDGSSLEGEVTLLAPTGNDLWVEGQWRGNPIQGRAAPGESFQPGETAWFSIPCDRVCLFDRDTGERTGS